MERVSHTFDPSTGGRQISEFVANLFYRVSSRTARGTQKNPDSKERKRKRRRKKRKEYDKWNFL